MPWSTIHTQAFALILRYSPSSDIQFLYRSLTFLTPPSRYSCHVLLSSLNPKLYDFTCSKYAYLPCVARAVIFFLSPKSICKYFSLLLLGAAHQAPTRLLRRSSSLYRRPEEAGAYHPPPWNCFMYIVYEVLILREFLIEINQLFLIPGENVVVAYILLSGIILLE